MATTYTYPHTIFNVKDNSVTVGPVETSTTLHLPIYFILSSMGVHGKIIQGSSEYLKSVLGADLFDRSGKCFSHANIFAEIGSSHQTICCMRVNGNTPEAYNSSLLEVKYDPSETTAISAIVSDDYTEEAAANTTIVENTSGEVYTASVTFANLKAIGAGSAYNNYGIRFWCEKSDNLGRALYSFQIIRMTDSGIVEISDIYGNVTQTGLLCVDSITDNTNNELSVVQKLNTNYKNLPFTLDFDDTFYKKMFETIASKANIDIEKYDHTNINWISGENRLGIPYEDTTTNAPIKKQIMMLKSGTDRLEEDKHLTINQYLDKCVTNYINSIVTYGATSDLYDNLRFPYTHISDSGFHPIAKTALSQLYKISDYVVIDWSPFYYANDWTGEVVLENQHLDNRKPSTYQTDLTQSEWIQSTIAVFPESELYNTGFMRGNIYGQTGRLNKRGYNANIPFTLNSMILRCKFHSGTSITGELSPRPNNVVTEFSDVSYTAVRPDDKQLAWDTGMNLAQYADTKVLFYPTYKSMHKVDNSLLSTTMIVDYLVYIKKIVNNRWTYFTGSRMPNNMTFNDVARSIEADILEAFNNSIQIEVKVYQTVANRVNGKTITIEIKVISGFPISGSECTLITEVASQDENEQ